MDTPSPFPASPFSNKPRVPLTPAVELDPDDGFNRKKRKTRTKNAWFIGGGVALAVVVVGGLFFSDLIATRVVPGAQFAVESTTLRAGEVGSFHWRLSPENQKKYPQERIDLCRGAILGVLTTGCKPIVLATNNDGDAQGLVPADFHPGTAYIKLTARDPKGGLFSNLWTVRKVTVLPATASEPGGGGHGGGDSNGGSGSDNAGNTTTNSGAPVDPYGTPTPVDPYGTPTPSPVDPYGQGYRCIALCTPSATGSQEVTQDCATFTNYGDCTTFTSDNYPYRCQWVAPTFMCPIVP